ncbi:MAG: MtrB/PioB family decaheme-associated outer membrane protein [Gammaproteobacteria bacterium]|nr:MtrB/PioB family decaheme-associated outer membrane protein [Gammaproteobacteria bacterium]
MKTQTSLLALSVATSILAAGTTYAAEYASKDEEGELIVPERIVSEPVKSKVELGIGYVSDDAYRFGRYNGLQTKGAFLVGDIDSRKFFEDGRFYHARGTRLGLESRYFRIDGGKQGSYKLFLEWDELPYYIDNTGRTPFLGIGSQTLTLPPTFTDIDTDLYPSLNSFELKTKRERLGVGASFIPKERWQVDIDASHETKKGVNATGSALATSATGLIGGSAISFLPSPVDYETDKVNAKLYYTADAGQLELAYHASQFNNANRFLSWQNPFSPTGSLGRMSLAPDNEFHQISLNGGYTLPYNSRLTGVLSTGRMTQNEYFLPYTINPAVSTSALPRTSLDGEVWLTTGQLKLSSVPLTKLRLNAELRYNERDNETPVATYDYVVLDSTLTQQATNTPYSFEDNQFKLDANYRFNALSSLRGGYKYKQMKRENSQREKTEENTLFAKWKVKPVSVVDLALYAEAGSRDGSDFVIPPGTNPALRKYNLADRDRTKVGAMINYMATEKLFLSARADYNKDDYTNTIIGLTEATQPVVTLDFSYQPRNNITTYGYYTYESIESSQNGEAVGLPTTPGPGTPPAATTPTGANWQADFEDKFDTIGVGAKWTDLGKWDVGADLVYSKSNGNIDMKNLVSPGTESQYPDNSTKLTSLKLWTDYHYSKKLVYKLSYWYEKYDEDNWAIDGWAPYDQSAVQNTLLFGNQTLDYDVHVISASASYRY